MCVCVYCVQMAVSEGLRLGEAKKKQLTALLQTQTGIHYNNDEFTMYTQTYKPIFIYTCIYLDTVKPP